MRAPPFWWRPPGLAARLLSPLGLLYGAATAARMKRPGVRAGVPVICIGNPTAGGAGKTPAALLVAERLRRLGRRPVFLSRGYGGGLQGPIIVDPARHGPADCGDEPLLLAAVAPTVVSRDRVAGAELAAPLGDVIVMDDGLQNPSLEKTLAIAVVDGATGFGNGSCIPAGPLRAPIAEQLPKIDAFLVIGGDGAGGAVRDLGRPWTTVRLVPDPAAAAGLRGRELWAFAGIGRPEKFFETLQGLGASVRRSAVFADHHPYARSELESLITAAERESLTPVTTEKDMVKIRAVAPDLVARIACLPVAAVPDDPAAFDALLARAVSLSGRRPC
jgi:tetraacyldisaccharide 4'-kinase